MSGIDEQELISVLQSSLYPGTKQETVKMIISYCSAAHLDPMQKPVHAVPMSVKNAQTGQYEWRDVIMPGIGLYRIQADRSGTYAGLSEPEYGPDKTETFTDKNGNQVSVTYPEWCKITARKMLEGQIVEFTVKEYWIENYATDSGKSTAPNAMWRKRPKGQIAKCAEAQALRKGWPEIGAQPTAEEMEGKMIDMGDAERVETTEQTIRYEYPQEQYDQNFPKWKQMIESGKKSAKDVITTVQSKYILPPHMVKDLMAVKVKPTEEPDQEFIAAYNNAEAQQ
ncbi:MAG: phage recombination protein Bet [Anaerolineales bacterium]